MIIVAKYKENIDWITEPRVVIDKDGEYENVGREAESYLNYIIRNYDNLPDVCVFTQGRISDHYGKDDINILLKMRDECIKYGASIPHVSADWVWRPDYDTIEKGQYLDTDKYYNSKPIKFIEFFKKILPDREYQFPALVYKNAIFAVNKDRILNRPKEFYENLIKYVNYHICPNEAYYIECMWYYIFN